MNADGMLLLPDGFVPELPTTSRAIGRPPGNKQAIPPEMPYWKASQPLAENLQAALLFGRRWIAYVAEASGYEGKRVIEEMFGEDIVERRVHHWNTYQRMVMTDQREQDRLKDMGYAFEGVPFLFRSFVAQNK
jgi:hypothetical protein